MFAEDTAIDLRLALSLIPDLDDKERVQLSDAKRVTHYAKSAAILVFAGQ
jgi:hypothetical protein